MSKKYAFYLLTYLLNIDIGIDIAIFCKYRNDIVSKLKKRYLSSTNAVHCSSIMARHMHTNINEANFTMAPSEPMPYDNRLYYRGVDCCGLLLLVNLLQIK